MLELLPLRRPGVSDEVLYPSSAGTWVHIVRQDGNEESICGVYSSIELARANQHRHERNDDEIVSYVLDAPPLIHL